MTTPNRPVARLAARAVIVALLAGLLASGLSAGTTAHAAAAPRITVTNDRGAATADLRYRTELTIRGRGFQSVRGGFGGVYLMFGWVDDPRGGSWRPSRGGVTGRDYRYIPDSEDTASSQGYLRFIAFPGSSTASEASAVLSRDGSFSVRLTVPGPTFQSVDRDGKVVAVDCRKVTCGVITIGAHGVKNAANESFTPVRFTTVYDAAPAGQQPGAGAGSTGEAPEAARAGATGGTGDTAPGPGAGERTTRAARRGAPKLVTDRLTAQAGRTLAFTATGFTPGEQVVGVLDDGAAGIGPLVAGPSGEVAGILPLPVTLPAGTHELRLTGAASGGRAHERFAIRAADQGEAGDTDETGEVAGSAQAGDADDSSLAGSRIFLLAAAVLFAIAVAAALARRLLRRDRRSPVEVA